MLTKIMPLSHGALGLTQHSFIYIRREKARIEFLLGVTQWLHAGSKNSPLLFMARLMQSDYKKTYYPEVSPLKPKMAILAWVLDRLWLYHARSLLLRVF